MTRALPWLGAALGLVVASAVASWWLLADHVVASAVASWWLLADHVVASLLSPGGLTAANLLLAMGWVTLRLAAVLGTPALIAVAGVQVLWPPDAGPPAKRGRG